MPWVRHKNDLSGKKKSGYCNNTVVSGCLCALGGIGGNSLRREKIHWRVICRQRPMEIWWELVSKWLWEIGHPPSPGAAGAAASHPLHRGGGEGGTPAPEGHLHLQLPRNFSHLGSKVQLKWPTRQKPCGPQVHFPFNYYSQSKNKALFEKTESNSTTRLAFFVAATTKFMQPHKHIAAQFQLSLVPKAPLPRTRSAGCMTSSSG